MASQRKAAGIKNVAARAGVSTATVSHVINNTRGVRPETRERVLAAARALRYTQNATARSLVTGRSDLVGLVISDIRNPFFPDLAAAFQEQSLLHQMDAVVMNTGFDPHRTLDCVKRLLRLRVPAIAFMTSEIDPHVRRLLAEHSVSAVYLDLGRAGRLASNIRIDYEHGVSEALEHLRSLGHRRIGFIGGSAALPSVARRRDAFLASARQNGGVETAIVDCDFTMRGGYSACSELLAGFNPTAVVAVNDVTAIGALHCAHDRGLAAPGGLSIVGFDDIAFAAFAQPPLTTVHIPRAEIGALAFRALRELIAHPGQRGIEHEVKTRLMVRGSTCEPSRE